MSDGKYFNITECAVTGDEIAPGDRIVKRPWGTYAVAARVQYTPDLETETENKIRPSTFRGVVPKSKAAPVESAPEA